VARFATAGARRQWPVMVPTPLRLRLYTRPSCCLCERVKEELGPWLARGEVVLEEVDISRDAALEARYGEIIPVLEHAGRPLGKGLFSAAEAMARLRRRVPR